MKVAENLLVAIDYCLTLDSGEEIDRSQEDSPLSFIVGKGQLIPGLEKELIGMVPGESAKVTVEAEEAYGPEREDLLQEIPRSQFPEGEELKPGMRFQAQGAQGNIMIVVKAVNDDTVTVDLNHPLAGKRLNSEVKVVEVREPSIKELSMMSAGSSCDTQGQDECGPGCSSCG